MLKNKWNADYDIRTIISILYKVFETCIAALCSAELITKQFQRLMLRLK